MTTDNSQDDRPEWLDEAGMWAKPSCNDCYGRGYRVRLEQLQGGVNRRQKFPCYCVKKERDRSNLQEARAEAQKVA